MQWRKVREDEKAQAGISISDVAFLEKESMVYCKRIKLRDKNGI